MRETRLEGVTQAWEHVSRKVDFKTEDRRRAGAPSQPCRKMRLCPRPQLPIPLRDPQDRKQDSRRGDQTSERETRRGGYRVKYQPRVSRTNVLDVGEYHDAYLECPVFERVAEQFDSVRIDF